MANALYQIHDILKKIYHCKWSCVPNWHKCGKVYNL